MDITANPAKPGGEQFHHRADLAVAAHAEHDPF
jgi:hypothetical protein